MSDSTGLPPRGQASAPALRASDADRERTVDLLRRAGGDGRLDMEELDARVSDAYAARTLADLQRITGDLIPAGTSSAAPLPGSEDVPVRPGPGGTRWIISLMSGHDRRGRWRVAAGLLVLCVMGGADLDLCDAELSDHETRIRVFTLMGGACLRFPSGVDVRVSKFALMGGHDVTLDQRAPPPGAPVIQVTLLSLMGGAEIRQGRRRKDRRRLRHGDHRGDGEGHGGGEIDRTR